MDKQREIYRKSIVKLFKDNFESALFEEKRDGMIAESDFEAIRDEIEGDYYIKNKGIAPYSKAIKYLRTKIEACTAAKTLFSAVEDFITAKENITITKINGGLGDAKLKKVAVKGMKRKKELLENEKDVQVHAECKSPHSCKKCRIMCRLDGSKPKEKKSKQKKKTAASKKETAKIEPSSTGCLDTPSKQNGADHSAEPVNLPKSTNEAIQSDETPRQQLPYLDHAYSRISFYGSGIIDDAPNVQSEAIQNNKEEINTLKRPTQQIGGSKAKQKSMPSLLLTNAQHRYKQSATLQQTAPVPAYYIQNLISQTATSCVQVQNVARRIPQRASSMPMNFNAPITFWPQPVIQQPVYYIQFVERSSNDFQKE